jgi:hypothetical protein
MESYRFPPGSLRAAAPIVFHFRSAQCAGLTGLCWMSTVLFAREGPVHRGNAHQFRIGDKQRGHVESVLDVALRRCGEVVFETVPQVSNLAKNTRCEHPTPCYEFEFLRDIPALFSCQGKASLSVESSDQFGHRSLVSNCRGN